MKTVVFKHANQRREGTVTDDGYVKTDAGDGPFSFEEIEILPPCQPTKVVGAARNYYADDAERAAGDRPDDPIIFFKPPSSLIGTGAAVKKPDSSQIICEGELGVVIDRECESVSEAEAFDYVRGYTCINDITAIDWGSRENYGVRTKGMNTFCPTGPVMDTEVDDANPERDVTVHVNGDPVADSNTKMMIFSVTELISHISQYMTLEPGDLIASGAPPENRTLDPGDTVSIEVEGIGQLANPIAKKTPATPTR